MPDTIGKNTRDFIQQFHQLFIELCEVMPNSFNDLITEALKRTTDFLEVIEVSIAFEEENGLKILTSNNTKELLQTYQNEALQKLVFTDNGMKKLAIEKAKKLMPWLTHSGGTLCIVPLNTVKNKLAFIYILMDNFSESVEFNPQFVEYISLFFSTLLLFSRIGGIKDLIETIFTQSPHPMWLQNKSGEFLLFNNRFLKLLKKSRNELKGKKPAEILSGKDINIFYEIFEQALREKKTITKEWITETSGIPKAYQLIEVPFKLGNDYFVTGICVNKEQQEKLKRENAQLKNALVNSLAIQAENVLEQADLHLELISECSAIIAFQLKETGYNIDSAFLANIRLASKLHDVGFQKIPENILRKPVKLNPNEWQLLKKHTIAGAEFLRKLREENCPQNLLLKMAESIALNHHEWYDGSGYPCSLIREEIPLEARIIAIADTYSALRVDRPYRKAKTHPETLEIIKNEEGTHFDPEIVEAFMKVESEIEALFERMLEQY
ncbi:HD domain-containing phosphohydrolase [Kosmotoga sp. DU53]|uniref:HD domain-containing phosphohydrolase n=1 Tax=Kosmotoga sp. DU53 TaxID=1310160 RepID=UPI0007C558D9|nr:HD domain-containing phosphohydrolase [Kosmotoga sp. DU53]